MLVLIPSADETPADDSSTNEWAWVRSADGLRVDDHGVATASRLPSDAECVLLVPPHRLSWHRVACPKAPATRLRAVLDGLLEDHLLDDAGQLHLALAPGAKAGQTLWVAACRAPWLRQQLATLQAAGHDVDRIAPMLWPQDSPQCRAHQQDGQLWLSASGPLGVLSVPLNEHVAPGAVAQLLTQVLDNPGGEARSTDLRTLTEPACAALAEKALGRPPEVVAAHDLWLQSAQSPWNLAQFEFSRSAQARRGQWLRETTRSLLHAPAWRPARWALVGLLGLQVVAINAQAWQIRQALKATQAQTRALLTNTFPEVKLVLDAPVQMRRALADLRQNSGQVSATDMETLLQALARAEPSFTELTYGTDEVTLKGFRTGADDGTWQDALRQLGWTPQPGDDPTVLTLKARP